MILTAFKMEKTIKKKLVLDGVLVAHTHLSGGELISLAREAVLGYV